MYPDDSLTLHTDLYQINMMQVYFRRNIHNKRAVLKFIFGKSPFIVAMLFLLAWSEWFII